METVLLITNEYMKLSIFKKNFINIALLLFFLLISGCNKEDRTSLQSKDEIDIPELEVDPASQDNDSFKIIIGTFLGNKSRNYYGEDAPEKLQVKWKTFLGGGYSGGKSGYEIKKWYGAGWTGQPLLTRESGVLYLYQGALDYNLKKIEASTGKVIWQYKFDDVIKGTGTIFINEKARSLRQRYAIVQGSRRGFGTSLYSEKCYSLRSVSLTDGNELWRYNVTATFSPSRDVDGSPLVINDTVIAPLENGMLTFLDPNNLVPAGKYMVPEEISQVPMYPVKRNRKNAIVESSPAIIDGVIYVTSGSGYLYGIDRYSREKVFELFIGSDLDGSPSVSEDNCLMISVEKEYIRGKGGVLKIDPKADNGDEIIWYYPVKDKHFADWDGGVIGSVAVKNNYCAFNTIEGYLYFVDHSILESTTVVNGPDGITKYKTPVLLDKFFTGPSISTPTIVGNKVIACSYNGIYLLEIDRDNKLVLLDKFVTGFEATPISYDGNIYVASRDGFLYCFY